MCQRLSESAGSAFCRLESEKCRSCGICGFDTRGPIISVTSTELKGHDYHDSETSNLIGCKGCSLVARELNGTSAGSSE